MDQRPIWGKRYRLELGKGFGTARWCVLSRDGRTEVAAGQLYEDAHRIFLTCEEAADKPTAVRATLDPRIIDFEEESRAEMRSRRRRMRWIPPK